MTAGPTISGIGTQVAPAPAGSFMTEQDILAALGIDARTLHNLLADPQCPKPPASTRMFQQVIRDTMLTQAWLREVREFMKGQPELERYRAQELAKARFEANQRRLHEENQKSQWAAEQAQLIQESAEANRLEAEGKPSGRGGNAVLPFSGGSV